MPELMVSLRRLERKLSKSLKNGWPRLIACCCCCCRLEVPLPPLVGVRTPRGFLLYESRMPPPLMRPPRLSPFRSFSAFVAYDTSSNYKTAVSTRIFRQKQLEIPLRNTWGHYSCDGSTTGGSQLASGTAPADAPPASQKMRPVKWSQGGFQRTGC